MTVSYGSQVANSRGLGCFLNILAKWKGSIYKLVWADLLLFLFLYYVLNLVYRFVLNPTQKEYFEKVVNYCDTYGALIPLSFVLGFFVNNVMTRWWNQYQSIPFPDNLAVLVSATIKPETERANIVRRTIMRYICVAFTATLTLVSPKVKKRFPTLQHFVKAGLLQEDELEIWINLDNEYPSYTKYWLPISWASNIVTRARHEGLLNNDLSMKTLLDEINVFRSKLGSLLDYDWISMPLVYTQVVTLAVYSYSLTALIGKQYIAETDHTGLDLYFPILPVLEFFFYMGWLKVAEVLINPFGDDDDDFEVVWMIDRNIQVSYLLVDRIHHLHPKLMKDPYWNEVAPQKLPYTVASEAFLSEYPTFSTNSTNINEKEQAMIRPNSELSVTDGKPARLWDKWLNKPRRRNIQVHPQNTDDYVIQEIPMPPIARSPAGEVQMSDPSDFEELKRQRTEKMKSKLIACIRAMRNKKEDDDGKIVDELIGNKKK